MLKKYIVFLTIFLWVTACAIHHSQDISSSHFNPINQALQKKTIKVSLILPTNISFALKQALSEALVSELDRLHVSYFFNQNVSEENSDLSSEEYNNLTNIKQEAIELNASGLLIISIDPMDVKMLEKDQTLLHSTAQFAISLNLDVTLFEVPSSLVLLKHTSSMEQVTSLSKYFSSPSPHDVEETKTIPNLFTQMLKSHLVDLPKAILELNWEGEIIGNDLNQYYIRSDQGTAALSEGRIVSVFEPKVIVSYDTNNNGTKELKNIFHTFKGMLTITQVAVGEKNATARQTSGGHFKAGDRVRLFHPREIQEEKEKDDAVMHQKS